MKNNYQKNELKETFNVKGIYTIHYFRYGKNFKVPFETHNFWEMVYIDSGEAKIIADDKEFVLKQGQAFFHKPNQLHTIFTENQFANSVIVSFECISRAMNNIFPNKIFEINEFEKQLLNKIVFEAKLSFTDKLDEIYLAKMTKCDNGPFAGEQLIKNSIELLLISISRNTLINENRENGLENFISKGSYKIVDNIISILKNNIYSKIDLDMISKKLAFSKTYIKSVFKKQTGTSIIQFYIKLKIDEAKRLISQETYTITEISYMLNFNSVHYFSRQFKYQTDMTPSEYANSIKADNVL